MGEEKHRSVFLSWEEMEGRRIRDRGWKDYRGRAVGGEAQRRGESGKRRKPSAALSSPGEEVQVELADHLTTAAVLHTVQSDVRVPHGRSVHQLKGQTKQLLVDVQQALSHHLHGEVLLQQVLIHCVLSLLHLAGGRRRERGKGRGGNNNRRKGKIQKLSTRKREKMGKKLIDDLKKTLKMSF